MTLQVNSIVNVKALLYQTSIIPIKWYNSLVIEIQFTFSYAHVYTISAWLSAMCKYYTLVEILQTLVIRCCNYNFWRNIFKKFTLFVWYMHLQPLLGIVVQ